MPADFDLRLQLVQVFANLQHALIDGVPRVLTAILFLLVMFAAAKLVQRLLGTLLRRIRFDALLEQGGIDRILKRAGVRQSLTDGLPHLAYYLLLFLFVRVGADLLGLAAVSDAVTSIFAYLPNVAAAILVFVVGTWVGQFAGQTVSQAAEESGIDFAKPLGSLVSGLVLFVVGIMALAQLRIDTEIVRIFTTCVLAGFALAFGLSFGLGTRDVTRNVISGFYARKIFAPGDTIEIRGHRGTLKGITATQTLIDQPDGSVVAVANTVFLDETVRS